MLYLGLFFVFTFECNFVNTVAKQTVHMCTYIMLQTKKYSHYSYFSLVMSKFARHPTLTPIFIIVKEIVQTSNFYSSFLSDIFCFKKIHRHWSEKKMKLAAVILTSTIIKPYSKSERLMSYRFLFLAFLSSSQMSYNKKDKAITRQDNNSFCGVAILSISVTGKFKYFISQHLVVVQIQCT